METRLNIAEILKDKPQNTRLYSSTYGNCSFQEYTGDFGIDCQSQNGVQLNFDEYGQHSIEGECLLFPSKEMRDWSKFSWKKGDVLVGNNGKREVLFSSWVNDNYTKFVGFHCLITNDNEEVEYDNGTTVFNTADFNIEVEDAAQTYINTIKERLEGKLNLETLAIEANVNVGDVVSDDVLYGICTKVDNSNVYCDFGCDSSKPNAPITNLCLKKENIHVVMSTNKEGWYKEIEKKHHISIDRNTLKVQPEFKEWDFITIKPSKGSPLIGVFKAEDDKKYYLHANLDSRGIFTIYEDSYCKKSTCIARLSTEEERCMFFDALAKKGMTWDAEKKQIVDLKPKWTPKTFDRVITRDFDDGVWSANIFSHMNSQGEYVSIGCVEGYAYCLPYNEETAKLIGTTKDVED